MFSIRVFFSKISMLEISLLFLQTSFLKPQGLQDSTMGSDQLLWNKVFDEKTQLTHKIVSMVNN